MQLPVSTSLFLLVVLLSGCAKSPSITPDPLMPPACDHPVSVDAGLYEDAPDDPFIYQSATIDGNCLKLVVRYGGGCEDVDFELIDAAAILESFPIQRNIRLSFEDNDLCKALVTRELFFDLTPLQVAGDSKIVLNLKDFPGSLTYQY